MMRFERCGLTSLHWPQGQDLFLFHSQTITVAARARAGRNTFGHLPSRLATLRRSFKCPEHHLIATARLVVRPPPFFVRRLVAIRCAFNHLRRINSASFNQQGLLMDRSRCEAWNMPQHQDQWIPTPDKRPRCQTFLAANGQDGCTRTSDIAAPPHNFHSAPCPWPAIWGTNVPKGEFHGRHRHPRL
jgi:hypothetical protein